LGIAQVWFCVFVFTSTAVTRAAEDPAKPTTSRAARDEAVRALPLQQLPDKVQAKIKGVLSDLSLYRRLPRQTIDCEPDLYLHLIRNPELVVNMWTAMGITQMAMDRIGPDTYKVSDGEGTKGVVQLLYSSDDLHVIYSEGTYDGNLYPRTVRGKSLILLRSKYAPDQRGRMMITNSLDLFLSIDNIGVEILAKTFSPSVGKTADHNFAETAGFVGKVSQTAETNPAGLARLVGKMQRVDQDSRAEFVQVSNQVEEKLVNLARATQQNNPQQATFPQKAPPPKATPSKAPARTVVSGATPAKPR